jgi:O-antigen/teichoic acid export membrane protein
MSLGEKIFSGAFWSLLERVATQLLQTILGIILARLLSPDDFGKIGLLLVFIALSRVFIDSGFTKALIQKQKRTKEDISTVFFFNIIISCCCYIILFLCAPVIANFYEIPLLTSLLRVLALSLIINAFFAIPVTLATIDLNFKLITKINLITVLISGLIAIYLAYSGYGVWALVYQTLIKSILMVFLYWLAIKWRPIFIFSNASFKTLFAFGSRLLASSLLNSVTNNISYLFIGKFISTKELGFYTQGMQYPTLINKTVSPIIHKVLLPTLSQIQDDLEALKKYTKTVVKTIGVFVTPLFFLLILIAEPFVEFLLGEKWLPAVPIIQFYAIARYLTIICNVNINILYVLGRTDLALKQEYIKIPVRLILILAAVKYGIVYVAIAELLATSIHFFINTYHSGILIFYGAIKQLKDLSNNIIINGSLLLVGFIILNYLTNDWSRIIIPPLIYLLGYVVLHSFIKTPEFVTIYDLSKRKFKQ